MSPSGFIEPCLPSPRHPAPTGLHQIKHDGDLLMARRGIRLLTRKGHEWAPRYPLIVAAVNYSRCGLPDRPAIATITAWPCSSDCVLPLTF
jgi:hypothetical protein